MDGSQFQEEGFNDWEQIQSPSLHTTPPTNVELDMVVIGDNYLQDGISIFPPGNHEGLQVTSQDVQVPAEPNSPPPPSSSLYSSSSSNILPVENSIRRRLRMHLEILRSGIVGIAAKLRYYAVCRGGFWSFASVTGVVAAMFLSFLYARVWRWRQRLQQEKNNNRLVVLLIKEKDQKINHLLHQIAQLNELLSARRRVPIVRVSQLIIHDRST